MMKKRAQSRAPRDVARLRRENEKKEFQALSDLLPLSPLVKQPLDKASIVRLTVSYLKLRQCFPAGLGEEWGAFNVESILQEPSRHILQCLDGFVFVVGKSGSVIYISETVSVILGLSQIDLIGNIIYDVIHRNDQEEMKSALKYWGEFPTHIPTPGCLEIPRRFCIRMKCTLSKRNAGLATNGYKVIHCTGYLKLQMNSVPLSRDCHLGMYKSQLQVIGLVLTGKAFPPSAKAGIKIFHHMFTLRFHLDFTIFYADSKILKRYARMVQVSQLTGYEPSYLHSKSFYRFVHPLHIMDIRKAHETLIKMDQAITKYYAFLTSGGGWIWMQSDFVVNISQKTGRRYILVINHLLSERQDKNVVIEQEQLSRSSKRTAGGSHKNSTSVHSPCAQMLPTLPAIHNFGSSTANYNVNGGQNSGVEYAYNNTLPYTGSGYFADHTGLQCYPTQSQPCSQSQNKLLHGRDGVSQHNSTQSTLTTNFMDVQNYNGKLPPVYSGAPTVSNTISNCVQMTKTVSITQQLLSKISRASVPLPSHVNVNETINGVYEQSRVSEESTIKYKFEISQPHKSSRNEYPKPSRQIISNPSFKPKSQHSRSRTISLECKKEIRSNSKNSDSLSVNHQLTSIPKTGLLTSTAAVRVKRKMLCEDIPTYSEGILHKLLSQSRGRNCSSTNSRSEGTEGNIFSNGIIPIQELHPNNTTHSRSDGYVGPNSEFNKDTQLSVASKGPDLYQGSVNSHEALSNQNTKTDSNVDHLGFFYRKYASLLHTSGGSVSSFPVNKKSTDQSVFPNVDSFIANSGSYYGELLNTKEELANLSSCNSSTVSYQTCQTETNNNKTEKTGIENYSLVSGDAFINARKNVDNGDTMEELFNLSSCNSSTVSYQNYQTETNNDKTEKTGIENYCLVSGEAFINARKNVDNGELHNTMEGLRNLSSCNSSTVSYQNCQTKTNNNKTEKTGIENYCLVSGDAFINARKNVDNGDTMEELFNLSSCNSSTVSYQNYQTETNNDKTEKMGIENYCLVSGEAFINARKNVDNGELHNTMEGLRNLSSCNSSTVSYQNCQTKTNNNKTEKTGIENYSLVSGDAFINARKNVDNGELHNTMEELRNLSSCNSSTVSYQNCQTETNNNKTEKTGIENYCLVSGDAFINARKNVDNGDTMEELRNLSSCNSSTVQVLQEAVLQEAHTSSITRSIASAYQNYQTDTNDDKTEKTEIEDDCFVSGDAFINVRRNLDCEELHNTMEELRNLSSCNSPTVSYQNCQTETNNNQTEKTGIENYSLVSGDAFINARKNVDNGDTMEELFNLSSCNSSTVSYQNYQTETNNDKTEKTGIENYCLVSGEAFINARKNVDNGELHNTMEGLRNLSSCNSSTVSYPNCETGTNKNNETEKTGIEDDCFVSGDAFINVRRNLDCEELHNTMEELRNLSSCNSSTVSYQNCQTETNNNKTEKTGIENYSLVSGDAFINARKNVDNGDTIEELFNLSSCNSSTVSYQNYQTEKNNDKTEKTGIENYCLVSGEAFINARKNVDNGELHNTMEGLRNLSSCNSSTVSYQNCQTKTNNNKTEKTGIENYSLVSGDAFINARKNVDNGELHNTMEGLRNLSSCNSSTVSYQNCQTKTNNDKTEKTGIENYCLVTGDAFINARKNVDNGDTMEELRNLSSCNSSTVSYQNYQTETNNDKTEKTGIENCLVSGDAFINVRRNMDSEELHNTMEELRNLSSCNSSTVSYQNCQTETNNDKTEKTGIENNCSVSGNAFDNSGGYGTNSGWPELGNLSLNTILCYYDKRSRHRKISIQGINDSKQDFSNMKDICDYNKVFQTRPGSLSSSLESSLTISSPYESEYAWSPPSDFSDFCGIVPVTYSSVPERLLSSLTSSYEKNCDRGNDTSTVASLCKIGNAFTDGSTK